MSLRSAQHEALVAGGIAARRIACVNESDAEVPVYSIVAAPGGYTKPDADSTREYMQIDYPTGSGDALFVTMGKDLTASSPGIYGHVWSVLAGPLWMNYEGTTPVIGDIVGPTEDSFKVSTDGGGFKVLQVDTTNERVRAVFLGGDGGGNVFARFVRFPVAGDNDAHFDPDFPCAWAYADVYRTLCSGSPAIGTRIRAWDHSGCWLSIPEDDLTDVTLFCSKTKGDPSETGTGSTHGTGTYEDLEDECNWSIHNRCCAGDI